MASLSFPIVTLRRYSKTALMAATSAVGDSPLFLVEYLLRLVRVTVLLAIWRIILSGHGVVSGYTLQAVLTYTLISEIFAEQLACRTELDTAFWEGTLAVRSLQPMGLVAQFAADMFGRWLLGLLLFSLPLLLCAPLLGAQAWPAHASLALGFVVSLVLSVSVGLALEFLFCSMLLVLDQGVWVVSRIRQALTTVLAGAVLPLALLPWGLGNVFVWLPFASMASTPLRIYTNTGPPLQLIAVQAAWSCVLWPLALWLWQAKREGLVSHGG